MTKSKIQMSKQDIQLHIIAIGMISVILSVSGCGKSEPAKAGPVKQAPVKAASKAAASEKDDAVQHKVLSFNLEGFTEKGAKNWGVTGKSAESVSETEVKMNDIVAKSYGKGSEATITADEGVYDKTKNNVTLEKNVRATIENAEILGSAGLSDAKSPDATAGLPAEKKKKPQTVITCDGDVQFDYEKNLVLFNKNVKVINPDVAIDADMITVNLEPDTKKVLNIIAEGNVRIKRGDNITYSDKATYIEADKKVVLTGKPKIVMYQEGIIATDIMGK